ncbi:hypothetical protein KP509_01G095900 [Ceratopteris richardii]|uniref:Uncharacterized protein n=2 Tax=Ceratopteris richardii TaxID=49495 RepID=A0A8T2VNQ4_CERRI|nr:hypothetical protein KP509_01G095900 [Ceratopteris richardii]
MSSVTSRSAPRITATLLGRTDGLGIGLLRQQRSQLESIRQLNQLNWENEMEDLAVYMDGLAAEMKEVDKIVAISRVAGSTVSVAGGVMIASAMIAGVLTGGLLTPLVAAGVVASTAGGVAASGSEFTQQVILKNRVIAAKDELERHAELLQGMMGILQLLNRELNFEDMNRAVKAKESQDRILGIVVRMGTLVFSVKEITKALGKVLATGGSKAAVKAGLNAAGKAAGAFVTIGWAVYDVISASKALQNGGESCSLFSNIAQTVREIKEDVCQEVALLVSGRVA